MTDFTRLFIEGCWTAWLLYWVLMAFSAKRTVERGNVVSYRVVMIAIVIGLIAAERLLHLSTHAQIWHTPLALGILSDCIVVAGVAFTVWARVTLGRNWSAEVTFKQDHELIETGPYALARHPIYTGIITMAFGAVLDLGQAFAFVLFLGLCGGLWRKARQEERMMSRHFPDEYPRYRTRVHAIIPFVL